METLPICASKRTLPLQKDTSESIGCQDCLLRADTPKRVWVQQVCQLLKFFLMSHDRSQTFKRRWKEQLVFHMAGRIW